MNWKNIKKIRLNDFSEYEAGKCNNGGCYGFWTDYFRLDSGLFEAVYRTTADFDYCPVCGSFNSHYQGEDSYYESEFSCGEFKTVTEAEMLNLINNFEETEDCYIEYEEEDNFME